jgi:DNA transformation protein
MAVNEAFLNFIQDQLTSFGDVEVKRMFGGVGLFHQGLMFGMISGGVFRLKVDDQNKDEYLARGIQPHNTSKKKKSMPYWEVPVDVLEDSEALAKWVEKSYGAALRGAAKKK